MDSIVIARIPVILEIIVKYQIQNHAHLIAALESVNCQIMDNIVTALVPIIPVICARTESVVATVTMELVN
jgi:hypothetical protein